MKKIRVAGVPEHFNYPWHRSIKNGDFNSIGVDIEWNDFSGGTGAMAEAMRTKQVDLAILLTEGAVSFIDKGDDFKIIQVYVQSPLNWGIHVPFKSTINSVEDIQGKTYAISRFGSGSHLMSFVDAKERGWSTSDLNFELVGNMPGAIESFERQESQVFFWEKFTTQPFVDSNDFRRVGIRPTPWPCFVIVAQNELIESQSELLKKLVSIVRESASVVKNDEASNSEISKMYGLELDQVNEWKSETDWNADPVVSTEMVESVYNALEQLDLVNNGFSKTKFIADLV